MTAPLATNVIPFPEHLSNLCELREAERHLAHIKERIAYLQEHEPDNRPALVGNAVALEITIDRLFQARAKVAGTALSHNGVIYAETAGRA